MSPRAEVTRGDRTADCTARLFCNLLGSWVLSNSNSKDICRNTFDLNSAWQSDANRRQNFDKSPSATARVRGGSKGCLGGNLL